MRIADGQSSGFRPACEWRPVDRLQTRILQNNVVFYLELFSLLRYAQVHRLGEFSIWLRMSLRISHTKDSEGELAMSAVRVPSPQLWGCSETNDMYRKQKAEMHWGAIRLFEMCERGHKMCLLITKAYGQTKKA